MKRTFIHIHILLLIQPLILQIPWAEDGTVIEGTMQQSKLELFDEENKKFFLQKRYLFEQQEKQRKLEIRIFIEQLVYDMNLEVAAEIMLRYNVTEKMEEIRKRRALIEDGIQQEGEEYGKVLVKLEHLERALLSEGVEVESELLEVMDEEISRIKRRLKSDARKRILDYEKKKHKDIVSEVMQEPRQTVTDQLGTVEEKKKEMWAELATLGGAPPGLKNQIAQDSVPANEVQQQVMALLKGDTYTKNVQQLTAEALLQKSKIRQQYEQEQELYENIMQKVATLKVLLKRKELIQQAGAQELRRMYRREFRNALLHYDQGKYRLAAVKIDHLLQAYPSFDDVGTALFVLAECKLALNLLDDAERHYRSLMEDHPQNPYRGFALYRLIDLNYLYKDYTKVLEYYALYQGVEVDEDILMGIYYMVGRSHYFLGEYQKARDMFAKIITTIDYYAAGQYMSGVGAIQQDSLEAALEYFKKCAALAQPQAGTIKAMKQLYDEAVLATGHMYYQLQNNEEALKYYNLVGESFLNYDQVILGKLWVHFKQEEYDRAIAYASVLIKRYPFSDYVYEAQIMQGVSFAKLDLYDDADKVYDQIGAIRDGKELLAAYLGTKQRLLKMEEIIRVIESTAIVNNDMGRYVRLKRITRGLDSTYAIMGQCAHYLYEMFPVEKTLIEANAMLTQHTRMKQWLGHNQQNVQELDKELSELGAFAKQVKHEDIIATAEIEDHLVENIVSQIRDLDQQLQGMSLEYKESSLDKAVERSECGKLDIEFIQDQERQQRIEDIRSITRDIDAILEGSGKEP